MLEIAGGMLLAWFLLFTEPGLVVLILGAILAAIAGFGFVAIVIIGAIAS